MKLISRQGKEHTQRFPDLVAAIAAQRFCTLILDGGVAIYDERLISRFEWLSARRVTPWRRRSCSWRSTASTSIREGDLRPQALRVRRERLEYVSDRAPALLLPVRRLSNHGVKAWQRVVEHGYEGFVAKDPDSPYVGGRTRKWLKIKQPKYREVERGF